MCYDMPTDMCIGMHVGVCMGLYLGPGIWGLVFGAWCLGPGIRGLVFGACVATCMRDILVAYYHLSAHVPLIEVYRHVCIGIRVDICMAVAGTIEGLAVGYGHRIDCCTAEIHRIRRLTLSIPTRLFNTPIHVYTHLPPHDCTQVWDSGFGFTASRSKSVCAMRVYTYVCSHV